MTPNGQPPSEFPPRFLQVMMLREGVVERLFEYSVERLYADQDGDLVVDAVPAVLAWLSPREGKASELRLLVNQTPNTLRISWDLAALARRDPSIEARRDRLAKGKSAQREHVVELAAYGLALCALSVLLPGRRAIGWSRWVAPDILLDDTPGALRGVEVAGRSRGGAAALRVVLEGGSNARGKRQQLASRPDVVEAYVSLWCARPPLSFWVQIKP
jgi:hypothetical protein